MFTTLIILFFIKECSEGDVIEIVGSILFLLFIPLTIILDIFLLPIEYICYLIRKNNWEYIENLSDFFEDIIE